MSLIQQVAGQIVPSGTSLTSTAGQLLSAATEAGLALAFPDQFASFSITLQVISSPGTTSQQILSSLTFPVMPESLIMAQKYLVTVTPTLSGVYVDDFGQAPSPIVLSGTFGVNSKPVVGAISQFGANIGASIGDSTISPLAATGFGMAKMLSKLVDISHLVDKSGNLPSVVLYNWAFNTHWEVVIEDLTTRMDVINNRLWMYNLQLITLRPYTSSLGAVDSLIGGVTQKLAGSLLTSNAATVVAGVSSVLGKIHLPSTPSLNSLQPALPLVP